MYYQQYSLEGHQFAVFAFCLTSDLRYVVSISNRFITWDLSTSDLTRDVNPGIEGIMQQLVLSPDNKWAAAYTNINQVSRHYSCQKVLLIISFADCFVEYAIKRIPIARKSIKRRGGRR